LSTERHVIFEYKLVSQRRSVLAGLACAALVFCWQWLTVHANYQAKWNAIFCTGAELKQPPELADEHIYLFADSQGYDGQMYHYVAHDPFFVRGFDAYLDAPRMRYRRILVPLAAHVLALGQDRRIDAAYFAVLLAAVFLGGYWLSVYCSMLAYQPAWGLAFLLVPATLISMDRATVDVLLVALCIAFAICVARGSRWLLYAALVAAPLVRETGLLLVAGYFVWLGSKRKMRQAVLYATAALPALGWYLFVLLNTESDAFAGLSSIPFQGIAQRILTPYKYQFAAWIGAISTVLDYIALAGILLAVALAVRMALRREWGATEATTYAFALLAIFLYSPGAWTEVYAFGRTLSPLLLLVGLGAFAKRNWLYALPLALVVPRTAIQLAPQAGGILRHFL